MDLGAETSLGLRLGSTAIGGSWVTAIVVNGANEKPISVRSR